MKVLSTIALLFGLVLAIPNASATAANASATADRVQEAENQSLHPDYIATIESVLDRPGKIYTVNNLDRKLLLRVYVDSMVTEVLYPKRRAEDSGAGVDLAEKVNTDLRPLGPFATELILDGPTQVYAVTDDGVLVGFLIVNVATGTVTYESV